MADTGKSEKPDKPISEWTEEERYRVAHSDDAPGKDGPGWDEEGAKNERGFIERPMDKDSELEGQGESIHDLDAGTSDEGRVSTTLDGLGVPKPSDMAAQGTEATIDVNTAGVEDLCKLRGVAEVDAKLIVEYREEHGPFGSINELVEVEGFARSRVATLARQGAYAGGNAKSRSDDDGRSGDDGEGDATRDA